MTGALTSEAAATAAREILPKRIIMLLFVRSALHSGEYLAQHAAYINPRIDFKSKISSIYRTVAYFIQLACAAACRHKYVAKRPVLQFVKWVLMKIAIHQMCSTFHPETNADLMIEMIGVAARGGAQMYFAPEMSILIDRDRKRSDDKIFAEPETLSLNRICAAAEEAGIWVHLGSIPIRSETVGQRMINRTIIIDEKGNIRARYDKMHLFDVALASGESWRESSVYDKGDSPVVVETPLGLMGLTICYDMRFPDLFSALSKAEVDVIAVPAAFTVPTGKAHWHTLLRARAIEAQAFVIAAAQSGEHQDGRRTYGHSLVVDPWGEVLLDMGEGEGLGFAELDLTRISEVRSQIPVHANRRSIDVAVRRF